MALPQMMFKIWTGDVAERFTHRDMGRVEDNINRLARELDLSPATFTVATRSSQFRYDDAQKVEDLTYAVARRCGVAMSRGIWTVGRYISYADFERWESVAYGCYQRMGGIGERIPSDKRLITVASTIHPEDWLGSGPFYADIEVPMVHSGTEAMIYGSHGQTVEQRVAEYNAMLQSSMLSDGIVRIQALSVRPRVPLTLKITQGTFDMQEEISLKASSWVGSGPWTQTVTLEGQPSNAVIGAWEGMSASAVEQMSRAIVYVSGISGSIVTVTAIGEKPTANINPMLGWEEQVVE